MRKTVFKRLVSEVIVSTKNPRVKQLVKLRESARRRREVGRFPIEGLREINAGLAAEVAFAEAFFCPSFFRDRGEKSLLQQIEHSGAELVELGKEAFSKASYRQHPEGILVLATARTLSIDQISLGENSLVLVLDEIEKPGNLGAILRTASAFGADALLLAEPSVDFFNPNVLRASRGLSLSFPVASASRDEVYAFLKEQELRIFGTSAKHVSSIWGADLSGGSAILLGSEKQGLGDYWRERWDEALFVPMAGTADSLNVSAAAACILYEMARQRASA